MEAAEQQFHVLAVDDSLVDRKLIERLLRTSSYQVTTVDSANKALEFLGVEEEEQIQMEQDPISLFSRKKDVQVNLVITDYCMPGMTGYDLLRKIKESSFLRNIPVVIMSSENVPSRIKRCLEEGAEEFLLKPVRLPDVNKLKPHILRAKYEGKGQEELKQHHDDIKIAAQQQLQLQQQSEPQQMQQQQLHPQQQQHKNYKRKSLEEGIPVERTSHRYSGPGLAVA